VPVVTDTHDPSQIKVLIGDPTKHEFDAVEIVPRPITHVQPPLDESKGCYLEVANLREAELTPPDATFKWNKRSSEVGIKGNSVKPRDPSFHRDNVKALAIYGIQNHQTKYPSKTWTEAVNYTGYESVWKIGQQKMLPDGSLKMRVPCEQPFYMSAVDDHGKWITHDPWGHSLQQGETKTCFGCHDGHSIERRTALGAEPQAVFAKTQAAGTTPALIDGHKVVSIQQVGPILEKACSGCHEGFQNDSLIWSRVFADQEQIDFPFMKQMLNMNKQPLVPRPYWTGLTGRYARQSMLVWVMEGQRLDGWQNTDFADDQDYPTNHPPVSVTPQEIRTVVDFIQQGAPMIATPTQPGGC
jgi:hypothetical protein